ncbi:hypothetical protein WJX84_005289 [Apatococcus fuscideae]|uniref:Protein root UVB sensitive/RUS domain-containing protein n=1 Tax=Apatococcus fuscideae TaxID=2026836 RepID=A0AAW1T1C0_9CHLO
MSCACQYSSLNRLPTPLGLRPASRLKRGSLRESLWIRRSLETSSYCSSSQRSRRLRLRAKAVQQEHNQLDPNKATPANLHRLPLGIKSGQSNRQYVWDGGRLYSVDVKDLECGQKQNRRSNLKDRWRRFQSACWSAFFPRADQVWQDYWGYTLWHTGHRLCSSMLNILSTQALLKAIGIGAKRALPAAAGINWVLKDGLGKMGRLGIAACFGSYFDANLKRFRFITALLVSVCTLLEFITPMFPGQFLLLASLANVGKSIGLTTYVSTQPAVLKSFAKSENVAELSAKQQAQQMVMDNLGLALCVAMAWATRGSPQASMWAPIIAMPLLTIGDITSIYNELRNTHLRMLNKERAEMVAEAWADGRPIPTPAQVSAKERVVLPPRHGSLPLALVPIEHGVSSPADLARLQRRHAGQHYMLSMQPQAKRQRRAHQRRSANPPPIPPSMPHAATDAAQRAASDHSTGIRGVQQGGSENGQKRVEVVEGQPVASIDDMLQESHRRAMQEHKRFVKALEDAQWMTQTFMLSNTERFKYSAMN